RHRDLYSSPTRRSSDLPAVTVAIDEYLAGNVDEVALVYTRFLSVSRQVPTVATLIPVKVPERKEGPRVDYLYEPEAEEVLSQLRSEEHTSELQSRGHLV